MQVAEQELDLVSDVSALLTRLEQAHLQANSMRVMLLHHAAAQQACDA